MWLNICMSICNMNDGWEANPLNVHADPWYFTFAKLPQSAYNLEKITHINPECHATTRGAVTFRYMLRLALNRNLIWSLGLWEKPHFMVSFYVYRREMQTNVPCWDKSTMLGTRVPCTTLEWPFTEGPWLFCNYFICCVSYTVVVLTCFVMCGCFGNVY